MNEKSFDKKEYRAYRSKRKPNEPYFPEGTIHKNVRVDLCGRIFEWDEAKNAANKTVHGIDFYTAICVFNDEDCLEDENCYVNGVLQQQVIGEPNEPVIPGHPIDTKHAIPKARIGQVEGILFVVFTERATVAEDITRIISARPANKLEREGYFERKLAR